MQSDERYPSPLLETVTACMTRCASSSSQATEMYSANARLPACNGERHCGHLVWMISLGPGRHIETYEHLSCGGIMRRVEGCLREATCFCGGCKRAGHRNRVTCMGRCGCCLNVKGLRLALCTTARLDSDQLCHAVVWLLLVGPELETSYQD